MRRSRAMVVAAVAAAGVLSACGTQERTAGEPPPPAAQKPWDRLREDAHDTEAGRLAGSFALLRGRPEGMPAPLLRKVAKTLGAQPEELQPQAAQHARTHDGAVWVLANRRAVCLARAADGSVACEQADLVRRRGMALGTGGRPDPATGKPPFFLVYGLVPDGARAVRLRIGGKRSATVRVRRNVYSLRAREIAVVERLVR
jgi:hypothetical protein